MERSWKDYNKDLVRRGEILIDPEVLDTQSQHNEAKKLGRPFKYPKGLIIFILFLKHVFKLPYRQMGISTNVPNFRTIHYRHTREDFHFDHLPDNLKDLPQDFVIVLDSTG
ncbi:MAG: transposase, partial [Aquificaceae bacterium]|nr:transposase [Aquificaceae bacterium]